MYIIYIQPVHRNFHSDILLLAIIGLKHYAQLRKRSSMKAMKASINAHYIFEGGKNTRKNSFFTH